MPVCCLLFVSAVCTCPIPPTPFLIPKCDDTIPPSTPLSSSRRTSKGSLFDPYSFAFLGAIGFARR